MATGLVLVLGGFSETVGRIVPLLARTHRASRMTAVRLLVAGTVVEAAVFAMWPVAAWTVAELAHRAAGGGPVLGPTPWTPADAAPLLFCAVFAFPLIGPALHVLVLTLAGLALTDHLAALGSHWWASAGSVLIAGVLLAAVVSGIRRGVGAWVAARSRRGTAP